MSKNIYIVIVFEIAVGILLSVVLNNPESDPFGVGVILTVCSTFLVVLISYLFGLYQKYKK